MRKKLRRPISLLLVVMMVVGLFTAIPITAGATEVASGTYWRLTDDDNDGKYKLIIFGTVPDTGGSNPWANYKTSITEVTTEEGAKTSADARYLFQNLSSTTVMDLSHLDTSDTTNMVGMFNSCRNVTSLNLSNFDTSNVTNMSGMFNGCTNLTTLDLSSFNTSNVEIMSNMFLSCTNLTSLNLNRFNTSNVTSMSNMFNGCGNLTTLDLSSFNTSNVTNMGSMFNGCENLTTLDLSSFNTSNVTSMTSMFQKCKSLTTLDLSGFNTQKVTYMSNMFYGCDNLTTLDLSGFNTQKVNYMGNMFYGCEELTTIYVGNDWNTGTVPVSDGMFSDCKKLVGGQGTIFDSSKTDKTYAHIDGGTDNPGYLTSTVASIDYTVVWKNADGTVLETDENVAENATPSYDGATPTKVGDDGKKYAFVGWSDGTNIYALNSLPEVTGNVTYTATFEEYDKDIAQNVGYFVGDKINFGNTYIKDSIWSNANTYSVSGVYTLTSLVYDSNNRYYLATLQSGNETIQLITSGSTDLGEQVALVCSTGQGTERYPYQFRSTRYGTVIWKDKNGNVIETDEKVLNSTKPSYNGEALTKESEDPDKYYYALYWNKDNANDPYEHDELFPVVFNDSNANTVTYNAVFLKVQYIAENGVYFIGDTIDFNGKYVKLEDSSNVGVLNFKRTVQNIRLYDESSREYQVALYQNRSTGYYYFTVDELYGTNNLAYIVKSGNGTEESPYIMGIAPYYTVTWQNDDGTLLETDKFVGSISPSYDGETPAKESTAQYNYTFAGWTSDGGTTVYTAETLPVATEDVTYTAQFTESTNTYTVIWKNEDGTVIDTTTVAYGDTPTHADVTKEADAQYTYTFSGWSPEVTVVTGDVTYTATFTSTVNQYTVTFNSNGGSTVDAQTVAYGSTASVPAEPTKEGYNFTGWYNGETAFDFTTAITENITLTAGWEDTKNYIDKGKHLWYTFDETNGALVIYGDGNAATMARFFYEGGGKALNKKIKTVTFDASANVSGANSSFRGCSNLTTVEGNLPSGTIQTMFYGCTNLESVPAIPTNASNTSNMFKGCTKLTSIGDDNNITLRANMINGMFEGCKALSANVIIDNRFSTVSEELGTDNIDDIFTGAATEDGTKIIVCFGSLIKHNNQYAMENIKSQMGGNVQLHDMSNYVDDGNGTTHSHICSQCGEKETENHTFDNGVCTVCGALEDYTITVTNGIIAKGEKEIYHVGDIVNLQADTPEEGKVFAYWQDANGNKLSTKANYSFVVLQNIDLTAVYNDNYVAEEILNISAVQTSSNGKNAIRFVFNRSVDTKAEVEEVGLIYATNKLAGYTSGAKVNLTELEGFDIETVLKENTSGTVKTYKSTSTSINGTIRFTYTIGNNTDSYVYAYGYVKLADGTTVYTDLLATTYNSIG